MPRVRLARVWVVIALSGVVAALVAVVSVVAAGRAILRSI